MRSMLSYLVQTLTFHNTARLRPRKFLRDQNQQYEYVQPSNEVTSILYSRKRVGSFN